MASLVMESPRKRLKQWHGEASYDRVGRRTNPVHEESNVWLNLDLSNFVDTPTRSASSASQLWSESGSFDENASPGFSLDSELEQVRWPSIVSISPLSPNTDTTVSLGNVVTEAKRRLLVGLRSPFGDNSKYHLPATLQTVATRPPTVEINSYIKLPAGAYKPTCNDVSKGTPIRPSRNTQLTREARVHSYPPHFDLKMYRSISNLVSRVNIDDGARKILQFYCICFCPGRTVLEKTNPWDQDLAPMALAPVSEVVLYIILALSCIYLLDLAPSHSLRKRAIYYYAKAARLLDSAVRDLNNRGTQSIHTVVGATAIFILHDVILFERRRPTDQIPLWLEGARFGSEILDAFDPAHRFEKSINIQRDSAWISNATLIARAAIFALPLTALDASNTNDKFKWLLHGDDREKRRIHGASGLSPKLLHMWSQATHLCAKLQEDPDTLPHRITANLLLARLESFSQWSELSNGYESLDKLFAACQLGDQGFVNDPGLVTDLGAQAWAAALKIYLLCRFYRLPRRDPVVLAVMNQLEQCIRRMPTSGNLFTAQMPLLPIFMLGLLGVETGHRAAASCWFESVLATCNCRCSVIPLWPALRRIWDWIDGVVGDSPRTLPEDIGRRDPWWERMVQRIEEREGTLCLI